MCIRDRTYYYLFECNTDPSTGSWGYRLDGYGYREENHKVFKSYYYSDTEEILYDFNLSVGDSVYIDSIYYSPTYAHITTVDSIFLAGEFRKRILFDNPPEVWIEGIGSLYSPFNPIRWCMQMGSSSLLLCATDSTGNLYMNPEYNSCYLDTTMTSVTELVKNNSNVRISNNPMHEFSDITFENQTQQFRSYNLYNPAGILVRKDCIINSGFTLYRNMLPAGIYLLQLVSKTGWQNFRIIIE
jgi:hypothetical protein